MSRVTVEHHDQEVEDPLDSDVCDVGVQVVMREFRLVTKFFFGGRTCLLESREKIVRLEDVVNRRLRETGDVLVNHLISQLAVTDVRMKPSVRDDGIDFGRQDLPIVDGNARLRCEEIAGAVEPSVVRRFPDAVGAE
jgi:hypothetical protein